MRNSIFSKQLGITDVDPDELAVRAKAADAEAASLAPLDTKHEVANESA